MLAVGEHLWGDVPELLLRVASAFGGGVGGCHEELCGVLAGGVLLAGALGGRTSAAESDTEFYDWICDLRQRFVSLAGSTECEAVRMRFPEVDKRCLPIVEDGVRLIMERLPTLPRREG